MLIVLSWINFGQNTIPTTETNNCVKTEIVKRTSMVEKPVVEVEETVPYFSLSDEERKIAECIVMGEAGGESYEGQMLVAQCLLNACLKDGLQPSEVRSKYQYAGWNESPSDSVSNAVSAVFENGEVITSEPILYFYAPKYCSGSWHETQRFVLEHGGHRFFAEWK